MFADISFFSNAACGWFLIFVMFECSYVRPVWPCHIYILYISVTCSYHIILQQTTMLTLHTNRQRWNKYLASPRTMLYFAGKKVGIFQSCPRVPKLWIWLLRRWGRCLKVTLQTHAPKQFCCFRWGGGGQA